MKVKKLAQYGVIYAITSLTTQLISMLMVPVFTKNLTQDVFGQYNLLISIQSLFSVFTTLGVYSGLSRFFYEYEDKNRLKNVALTFSCLWGGVLCIFIYFFGTNICSFVFKTNPSIEKYIAFVIYSSVLICIVSIYTVYFSMQYKVMHVTAINLGKSVLLLGFSFYLIAVKQRGLYGALEAQLMAYASIFILLVAYDIKNLRLVFSRKELGDMIFYGLGLVPGQASAWVYTLIDRYFIQAMLGLKQVGLYSMGYKLGMIMEPLFLSPFKSVFTSYKYSIYKNDDAKEKIREVFTYYNFIGWFCILGFSVFSSPAIKILSTSEYAEAFLIVPIIAFSYFLQGLGEFYSLGLHIYNKPKTESLILGIGAVTNILLNLWLIPFFGVYGAAYATVISYFIMNIMSFFIGKHYMNLELGYFEPFKQTFIFIFLYIMYLFIHHYNPNLCIEIIVDIIICMLFIFFSVKFGFLPKRVERRYLEIMKSGIMNLLNRNEKSYEGSGEVKISICKWYNNANSPVLLTIDDLANTWVDLNCNGMIDAGEDWGYGKRQHNSAVTYLENNILKNFPKVKVTFFLPVGKRSGVIEKSNIPVISKPINCDLDTKVFFKSLQSNCNYEIAYHGITHGKPGALVEEFIHEWKVFSDINEAISEINKGKEIYWDVFHEYPKGGKYCGYLSNSFSDESIDKTGFVWWCRHCNCDLIEFGPCDYGGDDFNPISSFDIKYFGENKVIDIPTTVNGLMFSDILNPKGWSIKSVLKRILKKLLIKKKIGKIKFMLKNKLVINIYEHMSPSRNDGRRQIPNIYDDEDSLKFIFNYLSSENVWYCTGTELANYVKTRDRVKISILNSNRFYITITDEIEKNAILTLCVKGTGKRKIIMPNGTKRSIKGDLVNIPVIEGEYIIDMEDINV